MIVFAFLDDGDGEEGNFSCPFRRRIPNKDFMLFLLRGLKWEEFGTFVSLKDEDVRPNAWTENNLD